MSRILSQLKSAAFNKNPDAVRHFSKKEAAVQDSKSKITWLLEKIKIIGKYAFSKNKAEVTVGIKIGHSNMVAVELLKDVASYKITRFELRPVPADEQKTGELLQEMFLTAGFSTDLVNTSISGNDVIIRFIHYPYIELKALKDSLEFEAEKYIPFNVSDVFIDFQILNETKEKAKQAYSLALVAAKKETVAKVHGHFQKAGVNLNAIDVDSFAATNVFLHCLPETNSKITALINIGSELTNITILKEGKPAFTRDLVFGGTDITKRIAKILNLEMDKAAEFKMNIETNILENRDLLKKCMEYLLEEIKLSFDFFKKQQNTEETVTSLYLLGGSSQIHGIEALFTEAVGIPSHIFNPLDKFIIGESVDRKSMEASIGSLAVPLGLAIRRS